MQVCQSLLRHAPRLVLGSGFWFLVSGFWVPGKPNFQGEGVAAGDIFLPLQTAHHRTPAPSTHRRSRRLLLWGPK